jgi:hypothetical protein
MISLPWNMAVVEGNAPLAKAKAYAVEDEEKVSICLSFQHHDHGCTPHTHARTKLN